MLRIFFLLSLFLSAIACGQSPLAGDQDGTEISGPQLPENLLGVWSPYSRSYQEFGDLVLGANSLSWGPCAQTAYRVLQVKDQTYYLELLASSACTLSIRGAFVILAQSDKGLEVSLCGLRDELDRAPSERHCDWGIFNKKDR